jgi:hypothetical protein
MDEFVVFALVCGLCRRRFHVCRPDYRGQGYCTEVCSDLEKAALHRQATARHQRSDEGRQDHAEQQRALMTRKRAEAQAVTDVVARKLRHVLNGSRPPTRPRSR